MPPGRSTYVRLLALACAALIAAACGDGAAEPGVSDTATATTVATATPTPTPTPRRATIGLLDDASVDVDQPAPDFLLNVLGGGALRLSDFRGKTVVLNFWASWCEPCRREMPDFQELWEERGPGGPDDLVILAVNLTPTDTRAAATAFVEEFDLTFPIMFDTPRGEVARGYGVQALPATFFIDRNGIVRTTALGTVSGPLIEVGVADADTAGGTYE